ncbi:hypothetical protein K432DRAFT_439252 [Lepidopterella palustris CBS 459.81]|uniref:Subtelomeric hrmA-associated cluster protein AFUB-079030/YDR124W-like helical bundle domain-containing protein n=1 Tax=Lepidopterella palustris CBS 459.81 TaxID=1314670 RepID=A0A8E2EK29_9PEZI|nr:hypothetical protein K432DRAFT_439252 [Lepidopterella palustris CBS 459.81]
MVLHPYEAAGSKKATRGDVGDNTGDDYGQVEEGNSRGVVSSSVQRNKAVVRVVEQALQQHGIPAHAFVIALVDHNSQVSYHASRNVGSYEQALFERDGWQQVRQSVIAKATSSSTAFKAGLTASAVIPGPIEPSIDTPAVVHEPMSVESSDGMLFSDDDDDDDDGDDDDGDGDGDDSAAHPSRSGSKRSGRPAKALKARKRKVAAAPSSKPRKRPQHNSRLNSATTDDESPIPESGSMSFPISDSDAVEKALHRQLTLLQQLSVKEISTAWIAVTEPKKQSNYPYNASKKSARLENRGRKKGTKKGLWPAWWPIDTVSHYSPHHLRMPERMELTIRLLRLPSRNETPAWVGDTGWIAKLEEATKGFQLLYPKPDKANPPSEYNLKCAERRRKILRSIYDIAKMEEEYILGDIGYVFDFPPVPKPQRIRMASTVVGSADGQGPSIALSLPPQFDPSPSELVSPTRRLDLEDVASNVIQYTTTSGEATHCSANPTQSHCYDHNADAIRALPVKMVPQEDSYGHSYSRQPQPAVPSRALIESQVQIDQSYAYDGKTSSNLYEEPPPVYALTRARSYQTHESPAEYVNWDSGSAPVQQYSNVTTSFAPPSTHLYDTTPVSTFPGRMDFSFPPTAHMAATASYQRAMPPTHSSPSQCPDHSYRTSPLSSTHGLPYNLPGHQF